MTHVISYLCFPLLPLRSMENQSGSKLKNVLRCLKASKSAWTLASSGSRADGSCVIRRFRDICPFSPQCDHCSQDLKRTHVGFWDGRETLKCWQPRKFKQLCQFLANELVRIHVKSSIQQLSLSTTRFIFGQDRKPEGLVCSAGISAATKLCSQDWKEKETPSFTGSPCIKRGGWGRRRLRVWDLESQRPNCELIPFR